MTSTTDPIAVIARAMLDRYRPKPAAQRRWSTPGALATALDPTTVSTPALDLIDRELVELADNPAVEKLIISMPPQEGKSVRVSQRFPEWLLTQNKDLRVVIVSYTDEMARPHGAQIKRDVEEHNGRDGAIDLDVTLRADSRAAGRWSIDGHRGSVYCVGVSGSLTSKPVDVLVIDDPLKSLKEAHSHTYRKQLKDFWQGVCIPRLGPGSKCVVIQTRWHEDDLAGWLQKNEPGQWRVVNIPAQAGKLESIALPDGTKTEQWMHDGVDPLGRQPGEYMVSARGDRNWDQIKANVGTYVWSALYQGKPSPVEGGLFKRMHLQAWSPLPRDSSRHGSLHGARVDLSGRVVMLDDCWRFLTVDLAASERTSADYTVAGVWAVSPNGDLILLDGVRKQIAEADHWPHISPLRTKWHADTIFVETGMLGTTFVYEAGRKGVPLKGLTADTDKFTRAIPAAVLAENGRLWLPSDVSIPDIQSWIDELVSFPNAAHDDVVDMVSYAARVKAANWNSQSDMQSLTRAQRPVKNTSISNAFEAATGVQSVDLSTARW